MYDMVRAGMVQAVPFAKLLGIELTDVGDGSAIARLLHRPEVCNHIGTIHAGALFTAAETASGAAVAGAFLEMIQDIRPVTAEARIMYTKLAKGNITCLAKTVEAAAALRQRLRDEHKVRFEVAVDIVREDEQPVARMTVSWDVRFTAREPAT